MSVGPIYILKKGEGGRHMPFHNKYRPQFYLNTSTYTRFNPDGVPTRATRFIPMCFFKAQRVEDVND